MPPAHSALFGLLWLEPAIPFASALVLLAAGRALGRRASAWLGSLSILASFIISLVITLAYIGNAPTGAGYTQVVWHWISIGDFHPAVALYLDPLSVVMTLTVAFVSFLIHVYSTQYMERPEPAPHGSKIGAGPSADSPRAPLAGASGMGGEATHGPAPSDDYARFFAYMNLFVASMLTLVLANNLLLLLLGWEGVGLCSYLLIGFWFRDEVNGLAGRKAFIVTRVGDTAFILGLFLLFDRLGTLNIQLLMQRAAAHWHVGAAAAEVAAFLLLGGAVGKSAQLPLQTWLPDAMAGPTPTSALIHAATMVTAGVYLIARTHVLYTLAPAAMLAVAIIGLATLLLAGCSALAQNDIKRILAYSTISQIGYMFLALGVGAWSAAIFHLVTHAFFKALLFLAAGVVIQALDDEHNIFKMGGLRHKMPLAFWCFLFAGASLAGLPLITAGFYSKGLIIWQAWASTGYPVGGAAGLWAGALIGAFLTALYIFRLIFVVFYGEPHSEAARTVGPLPGPRMQWPMAILAFLSMLAGFFNLPVALGGRALLSHFLAPALPMLDLARPSGLSEPVSELIAGIVFFVGLYLIWLFHLQKPSLTEALMAGAAPRTLRRFWFSDWGMDWLYEQALVHPTAALARANKGDVVDQAFEGIATVCRGFYALLTQTESGLLRRYAGWIAAGAIVLVVLGMTI